jgi:hypothetical protein
MVERRCLYCQQVFQPSKLQPRQAVRSGTDCQCRRRAEYHRKKLTDDPAYREVCRDSPRKWRSRHPDYWKQYRQKNPAAVERNRQRQQARDRKRKLCDLANNTSALDLKHALNTPFSDWGNILFNTTTATAIADRLEENSEIFLLGGDSLRKASRNPNPPEE